MTNPSPNYWKTTIKAKPPEVERGNKRIYGNDPFLRQMRRCVPKAGDDWVKCVSVVVGPNGTIGTHAHCEWTVLYYIDPAETPIELPDGEVLPNPGDVLVLRPNTPHAVGRNPTKRNRKSIAMLVTV